MTSEIGKETLSAMEKVTSKSENEHEQISQDEKRSNLTIPADFETAIAETGYGLFNYILMLVTVPCCFACIANSGVMSYILPSAECDLNLSLQDKGVLNAITYAGMVITPIFWGFLSDALGRRKLMIFGFLMDFFFNILCASSNSFIAIVIFKFIGGLIMSGPFAILMAYISELHSLQYRSRIMISLGIIYSLGDIALPALTGLVIPRKLYLVVIENILEYKTWQIFIALCATPSLVSGISLLFLPESPKFLMSKGRNAEAMKIFQFIHRMNKGASTQFPIKELHDETSIDQNCLTTESMLVSTSLKTILSGFRKNLMQMSIMFKKPHLKNAMLTFWIQFGILYGLNTLRLWAPQLFVIITEFENHFGVNNTIDSSLCDMIAFKVNNTQQIVSTAINNATLPCEPILESDMYMNTTLIGTMSLIACILATCFINSIGNKNLLISGLLVSGVLGLCLQWANSSITVFMFVAGYIAIAGCATNALISVTVSIFPTSVRTMMVSLMMMFGRFGGLLGNLIFPVALSLGCFPPFGMISIPLLICSLICIALPTSIKKPLQ